MWILLCKLKEMSNPKMNEKYLQNYVLTSIESHKNNLLQRKSQTFSDANETTFFRRIFENKTKLPWKKLQTCKYWKKKHHNFTSKIIRDYINEKTTSNCHRNFINTLNEAQSNKTWTIAPLQGVTTFYINIRIKYNIVQRRALFQLLIAFIAYPKKKLNERHFAKYF